MKQFLVERRQRSIVSAAYDKHKNDCWDFAPNEILMNMYFIYLYLYRNRFLYDKWSHRMKQKLERGMNLNLPPIDIYVSTLSSRSWCTAASWEYDTVYQCDEFYKYYCHFSWTIIAFQCIEWQK